MIKKDPWGDSITKIVYFLEEAEQSAGWIEELNKDEHTPETEEYGISSFVYRNKKQFGQLCYAVITKIFVITKYSLR